jgi:hypothetical protein
VTRISGIRDGMVFAPFHYGYWDIDTPTASRAGTPPPAPTTTASEPLVPGVPATAGGGGVSDTAQEEP